MHQVLQPCNNLYKYENIIHKLDKHIRCFFSVLFYSIIHNLIIDDNITRTFLKSILGALFLLLLYGIIFWIGFILALIIVDLILILPNQNNLKFRLLLEWIIICIPFIYWTIVYERQRNIYIVAIIAFFITQFLRQKLIKKATN